MLTFTSLRHIARELGHVGLEMSRLSCTDIGIFLFLIHTASTFDWKTGWNLRLKADPAVRRRIDRRQLLGPRRRRDA